MAFVEGKDLEKQVSHADSIERLPEDVIIQECTIMETPRCSKDYENPIASQMFESCIDTSIQNPLTWDQRLLNKLSFKRKITPMQLALFVLSLLALVIRLRISDEELLAEFCLFCTSMIFCSVLTLYYERGYYAKSVFVDSYPRETYVDSPERLEMTQLKSSSSSSSLYSKFLQSSSTSGHARALIHPPPPNLPESPTTIATYSDPRAIPGPSGLQKSP